MLLNFSDRTRTGAFSMIWPLAEDLCQKRLIYTLCTNLPTSTSDFTEWYLLQKVLLSTNTYSRQKHLEKYHTPCINRQPLIYLNKCTFHPINTNIDEHLSDTKTLGKNAKFLQTSTNTYFILKTLKKKYKVSVNIDEHLIFPPFNIQ